MIGFGIVNLKRMIVVCGSFPLVGVRVRHEITGIIGRPRFEIGVRRDEGA